MTTCCVYQKIFAIKVCIFWQKIPWYCSHLFRTFVLDNNILYVCSLCYISGMCSNGIWLAAVYMLLSDTLLYRLYGVWWNGKLCDIEIVLNYLLSLVLVLKLVTFLMGGCVAEIHPVLSYNVRALNSQRMSFCIYLHNTYVHFLHVYVCLIMARNFQLAF